MIIWTIISMTNLMWNNNNYLEYGHVKGVNNFGPKYSKKYVLVSPWDDSLIGIKIN